MKHNGHPTEELDTSKTKPAPKPARDEVAKKAYALYEKEGRPQGHEKQNWLEAEAQLSNHGSDGPKGHASPKPTNRMTR